MLDDSPFQVSGLFQIRRTQNLTVNLLKCATPSVHVDPPVVKVCSTPEEKL